MKHKELFTLHDYLKKLPSSIVFRHFVENSDIDRKILSNELVDEICTEFHNESLLGKRFQALPLEVQKICSLAYLFGSSGIKAVEHEEHHEKLVSSFLLYAAHNQHGISYYFGFRDLVPVLKRKISECVMNLSKSDITVSGVQYLRRRCLSDFMIVLCCALQSGVRKKQDGDLVQISYNELKNKLHISYANSPLSKKDKEIKKIVQLLLSYGLEKGVLIEDDKAYITTTTLIEQWLLKPAANLHADLINYAISATGSWNREIMETLLSMSNNTWLSVEFVPLSCKEQFFTILHVLYYLGFVELYSTNDELYFRAFTGQDLDSAQEQKVTICSDFSAVLPQEVSIESLYHFSHLGSITKLDQVYKGKIDKHFINEALSMGIGGSALIGYLQQWQAPENVIETVKEWIREFSRLCIISSETIMVFDQGTNTNMATYPPLADLIEPIQPVAVYKIRKGVEQQVRTVLTDMGFDPRVPEVRSLSFPEMIEDKKSRIHSQELTLSIDFEGKSKQLSHRLKSGKYSEELKELDRSELYHVVDYAILMSYELKFEYEGSPYIRQGIYNVIPVKLVNEKEPFIEAKSEMSNMIKKFYIKKIKKIGVRPS